MTMSEGQLCSKISKLDTDHSHWLWLLVPMNKTSFLLNYRQLLDETSWAKGDVQSLHHALYQAGPSRSCIAICIEAEAAIQSMS